MAGPWATGQELYDAVLRKAGDRDDLVDQVAEFVRLAEIRLQRELKLNFVRTVATGSLTAGVDLLALPSDCVEVLGLWIKSTPPTYVEVVNETQFLVFKDRLDGVGIPTVAKREGNSLRLADVPSSAFDYELPYQAGIPALTASTTNWLLDNGPDCLLYAALCELATELHDDAGLARWTRALGLDPMTMMLLPHGPLADLRRVEWRSRYGHGPLHARPRGPTP